MTPYLQRNLTNADLMLRENRSYEGCIARVVPQKVFNRFKYTKDELVPVISFEDGFQWIPNIGARRLLSDELGTETDGWIGRWVRIYLVLEERTDKTTGERCERWQKRIEVL